MQRYSRLVDGNGDEMTGPGDASAPSESSDQAAGVVQGGRQPHKSLRRHLAVPVKEICLALFLLACGTVLLATGALYASGYWTNNVYCCSQ